MLSVMSTEMLVECQTSLLFDTTCSNCILLDYSFVHRQSMKQLLGLSFYSWVHGSTQISEVGVPRICNAQ